MATRKIEKTDWKKYFDEESTQMGAVEMRLELTASELGLRAHRNSALRAHLEARHLDDPQLQAILIPPCSSLQGFAQLCGSIASL